MAGSFRGVERLPRACVLAKPHEPRAPVRSPPVSPMPDVSYQALLSRVRKQQLRLLLLLSPPRTGSTALEKALCQRFQADAQLNEPAAQFLAGEARVSE